MTTREQLLSETESGRATLAKEQEQAEFLAKARALAADESAAKTTAAALAAEAAAKERQRQTEQGLRSAARVTWIGSEDDFGAWWQRQGRAEALAAASQQQAAIVQGNLSRQYAEL